MDKVIISLISVAVGFLLYFMKDYFTVKIERKKVIDTLKYEINHNLGVLNKFWAKVNYEPSKNDGEAVFDCYLKTFTRKPDELLDIRQEHGKGTLFYRILSHERARYNFKVWDEYIGIAAVALAKKKFELLYQVYENLIDINIYYSDLHEIYLYESKKDDADMTEDQKIERIKQHSKKWNEFEKLITQTQKKIDEFN